MDPTVSYRYGVTQTIPNLIVEFISTRPCGGQNHKVFKKELGSLTGIGLLATIKHCVQLRKSYGPLSRDRILGWTDLQFHPVCQFYVLTCPLYRILVPVDALTPHLIKCSWKTSGSQTGIAASELCYFQTSISPSDTKNISPASHIAGKGLS